MVLAGFHIPTCTILTLWGFVGIFFFFKQVTTIMIQYIHFLLELEWISNNCGSKLLKGLMYSTSYQIKYNEGMSSLEFHLHTQLKKTVRSKRR